jgi:hypothetical protein
MANVCKSCGGDGPQVIYNYCRECVDRHAKGDLPLGGCAGCEILGDRQSIIEEETDATPTPGA